MNLLRLCILLLTVKSTYGGNILVTAGLGGSRLFSVVDVANVLAKAGHIVTLLTPGFDKRATVHNSVTWEHSGDEDLQQLSDKLLKLLFVPEILNAQTEEGVWAIFSEPSLMLKGLAWSQNITRFYTGDKVGTVFAKGNFDVIIADEKATIDAALAARKFKHNHETKRVIPLVMYCPAADHFSSRKYQNYPSMIMSEPGILTGDITPEKLPGFADRLLMFKNILGLGSIINLMKEHWGKFLFEYGLEDVQELYDSIELYVINDHPALTFPFLDPPNAINVAGFNLHVIKAVPLNFEVFLTSQPLPTILLSFGSYAKTDKYLWFKTLLEGLEKMEVKVVLKTKDEMKLSDKFMVSPWVPQRDLLASGLVSMFISHCGNNGRVETIYYNVPVICIPLFGDQYQNALYVQEKKFGVFHRKEDVTYESVQNSVNNVITHHAEYKQNMKKASDIINKDPASGSAKILYYIDLLVEYGSLNYLKNKIVKKQSVVEMYNLDIFALIGLMLIIVFAVFVYGVVKMCCIVKRRVSSKHKTE